jgi:hypothetical protein
MGRSYGGLHGHMLRETFYSSKIVINDLSFIVLSKDHVFVNKFIVM